MSSFNLGKKLRPAKRAWKTLAKALQTKVLEKLNISKPLNKTASRLKPFRRLIRRCDPRRHSGHHIGYKYRHLEENNIAAIYVDELFAGPIPLDTKQLNLHKDGTGSTSSANASDPKVGGKTMRPKPKEFGLGVKNIDNNKPLSRKSKGISETSSTLTLADAWKNAAVSRSLPKFKDIDEKAEEFISKFRQDIKIQREKSILEFQEMLARSS